MLVKELKSEINKHKAKGLDKNQTVEFVLNTQKYYVSDIKAGPNTMVLEVSRKSYHPLSIKRLEQAIDCANGELTAIVRNADTKADLNIQSLHCGLVYLEISAE